MAGLLHVTSNVSLGLYLHNSIILKYLMQTYLYLNFITAFVVCVSIKKEVSLPCDCRKRVHLNIVCSVITFPYQMKGWMSPVTHYLSNIQLKQWYLTNQDPCFTQAALWKCILNDCHFNHKLRYFKWNLRGFCSSIETSKIQKGHKGIVKWVSLVKK